MELIEGDTLRDRIKSGPIPVEEALNFALQMAEALEAAHEKGVIHRDLKPANIKVTPDGKVKILDFGLAKAFVGDPEKMKPLDSPTLSAAATQQGVILGTAAYMSPEQARGKPVNRRADIWAFGVVLYEMLTGKTAFSGGDQADTLAAVIRSEPEWKGLPANLHWRLKEVLERCLEKKAKDRYSGISDARVEIQKVLADPSGVFFQPSATTQPRKRVQLGLPLVATIAVICIIIAALAVWYLKPPEPRKVMRFSYELPENQQFTAVIQLAISPDGSQFVYLTTDGLYIRSVDALDARLVSGTDQTSTQPVFSPDGKWIAYWSSNDKKLKKIAISGGVPVILCDTSPQVGGLSWSSDNTIVYSDIYGGGVKRVSADGGTPEFLIKAKLVNTGTDGFPVAPQMLPDGKTLLFTNLFSPTNMADMQIAVQSFESGEREVLVGGLGARYFSSGHLVFTQVNNDITSLMAVPFDPNTMEVKSGPVPLLESISAGVLSDSGTLVYVPGTSEIGSGFLRTLVWVDREGKAEELTAPSRIYTFPRISPDGKQVAFVIYDPENNNEEIFIWDEVRKTLNKRTYDKSGKMYAIWTPDGERIVYHSDHEDSVNGGVYWRPANGTGEAEKLASYPDRNWRPYSFSSDGKYLLMIESATPTNPDISILSMEDDRKRIPLLQTEFVEAHPIVSPDNQYIAYTSGETGQDEIFVRPFPDVNKGIWQVSQDGGTCPLWSPDGRELFYLSLDNSVMALEVETKPTFDHGTPMILFQSEYIGFTIAEGPPWDIHPDGKRFLMMQEPGTDIGAGTADSSRKINIVLNWFEELKQRVPVHVQ